VRLPRQRRGFVREPPLHLRVLFARGQAFAQRGALLERSNRGPESSLHLFALFAHEALEGERMPDVAAEVLVGAEARLREHALACRAYEIGTTSELRPLELANLLGHLCARWRWALLGEPGEKAGELGRSHDMIDFHAREDAARHLGDTRRLRILYDRE